MAEYTATEFLYSPLQPIAVAKYNLAAIRNVLFDVDLPLRYDCSRKTFQYTSGGEIFTSTVPIEMSVRGLVVGYFLHGRNVDISLADRVEQGDSRGERRGVQVSVKLVGEQARGERLDAILTALENLYLPEKQRTATS